MDKGSKIESWDDVVSYVASMREASRRTVSQEIKLLASRQRQLKASMRSLVSPQDRARAQRWHKLTRSALRGLHAWVEARKSINTVSSTADTQTATHRPGFCSGVSHNIGFTTTQVLDSAVRAFSIVRGVCLEGSAASLRGRHDDDDTQRAYDIDNLTVLLTTGPNADVVSFGTVAHCGCEFGVISSSNSRFFVAGTGVYEAGVCRSQSKVPAISAWKEIHHAHVSDTRSFRRRVVIA